MKIAELVKKMNSDGRNFISSNDPIFNFSPTSTEFLDMWIKSMYGSRECIIEGYTDMCALVDNYVLMYQPNIERIRVAFEQEYNPIENYDKISEIKTTENGTEKNDNTLGGSIINTSKIGSQNNEVLEQTPTDDVQEFLNAGKNTSNTSERNDVNTTSYDGYTNSNVKSFEDRNTVVEEHTHGNVGVTKNQDMLLDETRIRLIQKPLLNIISEIVKGVSF